MVYRTLSELISATDDLSFASVMIKYLNIILLTATELFDLRNTLKHVLTEVTVTCHLPVNMRY